MNISHADFYQIVIGRYGRLYALHILPFLILAGVGFFCCAIPGDGSLVWLFVAVLVGVIFAAPITLLIMRSKKVGGTGDGSYHIVLRRGDEYHDLGPGDFYLGINSLWCDPITYNPKMSKSETTLGLQIKDGTFVDVRIIYTWKPDKDNLEEYFAEHPTLRLHTCVEGKMREWARPLSGKEIFYANPPQIDGLIPGLITSGPSIVSMVAQGSIDMSMHVRDNSALIEFAIAEIQDEARMSVVREQLLLTYPEQEHQIKQLMADRSVALRRRGLNANR